MKSFLVFNNLIFCNRLKATWLVAIMSFRTGSESIKRVKLWCNSPTGSQPSRLSAKLHLGWAQGKQRLYSAGIGQALSHQKDIII